MIKRRVSLVVLFSLLFLIIMRVPAAATDTKTDFFSKRSEVCVSLPHESTHSFCHAQEGSGHSILESATISFRAERDSVVSILFSSDTVSLDNSGEIRNTVTATVYSDEGNKICEARTDAESGISHIEFVSSYDGVYFLGLESRASTAGEYRCSYSISAQKDFDKTAIPSFPHKADYSEKNHTPVSFSKLFLNAGYDTADKYKVSIFEFSHEAGSVFFYKLNADSAAAPSTVVMSYDGSVYTPHRSHEGTGYSCGDAIELLYSAKSYLFVFSDGNFSLEADLLVHNEYKITELGKSFSGKLDTSDAPLMYNEEKIAQIKEAFPFSDIKNRNVLFFAFENEQSSVVSFICDRSEHKFFSLVSGELGLSHGSVYPLRQFGEYCSEISPCKYCYNSFINDAEKFYLCYAGTGNDAYIEVQSTTTHTTSFAPEEKYKPGDIIPHPQIQNIYSDEQIYIKLGIDEILPDVMKVSGYMMTDEAGTRYYFDAGSDITVPDTDGKIKLYATVECVYNSNTDKENTKHHSLLIAEITSDRGFLAPLIENVTEFFEGRLWLAVVLGGVSLAAVGTGAFFAVRIIKKKKSESNGICTKTKTKAETEAEAGKENEAV